MSRRQSRWTGRWSGSYPSSPPPLQQSWSWEHCVWTGCPLPHQEAWDSPSRRSVFSSDARAAVPVRPLQTHPQTRLRRQNTMTWMRTWWTLKRKCRALSPRAPHLAWRNLFSCWSRRPWRETPRSFSCPVSLRAPLHCQVRLAHTIVLSGLSVLCVVIVKLYVCVSTGSSKRRRKEEAIGKNIKRPQHELDPSGLVPLPVKVCFTCGK